MPCGALATRTVVVVLVSLALHAAAAPLGGLQLSDHRRSLFNGGGFDCATFCGAGRPCAQPCQQNGCSNCGGGSSGNTGGGSSSACPDDSGNSCGTECSCPSDQTKKTVQSSNGECYTCSAGGSSGGGSSSTCPDDSGNSCGTDCSCSSGRTKKTVQSSNGECYTCLASSSSSPPPPPAPTPPSIPPPPTPPPTPWPWQSGGAASTAAAAQKYCGAIDETKCYNTPDCGYCIAESYDSGCVPGDATGPWSPIVAGGSTLSDCSREWQAGTFRPPGSMCVTVVSSTDVRCYQDCMGGGQQQFIVPNQATCMQYDSAYQKTPTPRATRQGVQQHVTGHMLRASVLNMHVSLLRDAGHADLADQAEAEGTFQFFHTNGATAQHDDATTKLLEKGVKALESKGLKYAEDAACDATAAIGPEGPLFCGMLFNSRVGTWINNEIESIPLVQQATHWIASTCANELPSGLRSVADDVIDAYNAAKTIAHDVNTVTNAVEHPVLSIEHACSAFGSMIANSVYGWL